VGGVSLGNYIFGGLESLNHLATVFGCVLAAVLAILLDQLVRLLELAARRRDRRLAWTGAMGLLLVFAGGLYEPVARMLAPASERAVIATGPFTEQHVLDVVLARHLEAAGLRVDHRPGTSEGIQFLALFHDQVDCIVNYTGNVWTLLMKRRDVKDSRETYEEVCAYLLKEHGVLCLGKLGFVDAYSIVVPKDEAKKMYGSLEKFAEWAKRRGGKLRIGGDSQFFTRPEWARLRKLYGLDDVAIKEVAMDPTLMYGAVRDGQVDAIVAYSSDGRIPAYGLEILKDPERALPPYDAILLLSPAASRRPELRQALEPLVGAIQLETMRKANFHVDVDHWTARRAAEELLDQIGRGK